MPEKPKMHMWRGTVQTFCGLAVADVTDWPKNESEAEMSRFDVCGECIKIAADDEGSEPWDTRSTSTEGQ